MATMAEIRAELRRREGAGANPAPVSPVQPQASQPSSRFQAELERRQSVQAFADSQSRTLGAQPEPPGFLERLTNRFSPEVIKQGIKSGSTIALPTTLSAAGRSIGGAIGNVPGALIGDTIGDVAGTGANMALGLEPFSLKQLGVAAAIPFASAQAAKQSKKVVKAIARRTRAGREAAADLATVRVEGLPDRVLGSVTRQEVSNAYDLLKGIPNQIPKTRITDAFDTAFQEIRDDVRIGALPREPGMIKAFRAALDRAPDTYTVSDLQRLRASYRANASKLRRSGRVGSDREAQALESVAGEVDDIFIKLEKTASGEASSMLKRANRLHRTLKTKEEFGELLNDNVVLRTLEDGSRRLNLKGLQTKLATGKGTAKLRKSLSELVDEDGVRVQDTLSRELDQLVELFPGGIVLRGSSGLAAGSVVGGVTGLLSGDISTGLAVGAGIAGADAILSSALMTKRGRRLLSKIVDPNYPELTAPMLSVLGAAMRSGIAGEQQQ